MTRNFAVLMLTTALAASVGVTTVKAQEPAIAKIPFNFTVQGQAMPAGKYELKQPFGGNKALFSLSDWKGHSRYIGAPEMGAADPSNSKLTFACYSGDCSLTKIELPGSTVSYSLRNTTHHVGMATMISVRIAH